MTEVFQNFMKFSVLRPTYDLPYMTMYVDKCGMLLILRTT